VVRDQIQRNGVVVVDGLAREGIPFERVGIRDAA